MTQPPPHGSRFAAIVEPFRSQRALTTCLRVLYAMLRFVVPTDARQIGFVSAPDLTDNALALFETLVRSDRSLEYRLIWLVADRSASRRILDREFDPSELPNVSLVSKNTLRGLWTFLRCRTIFLTHGAYGFAHAGYHQTIVNLWHGMPIKTIGAHTGKARRDTFFMHYSIATSDYFAHVIAKAFYLKRDRVLVTGLPRNEWLFQREEKYLVVKEGRAKLVVWLPTFRSSYVGEIRVDSSADAPDLLSAATLEALDARLDGSDSMLAIKLHPMDVKNRQSWANYSNIRIYTDAAFQAAGMNLYKLLACSDALVTDFSSVAIDYLLLKKPIGLFAPDISAYTRGFIPGVLERLAAVGHKLTALEDLANFVINPPPEHETTAEHELLCQMDLRTPSESILRAAGL